MAIKNTPKRIPFKGGISTVSERAALNGEFSEKVNLRDRKPYGFIQRKAITRLHTTTDAAQEILSTYQFVDRGGTRRCYSQRADGSVHEATAAPPAVTTGNFGSQVLGTASNARAASWAVLNDYLLFSDGVRLPQIYTGTGQRIAGFHVYKGTAIPATPKTILDDGEDYTDEVTDSVTTRIGTLSSLDTLANNDAYFIGTDVPANSFDYTFQTFNGTASIVTFKYCKNDSTWATVSGQSDGTALAGATHGQNGAISFTKPTDEIPCYQFGKSCFWYQVSVSAALDSTVTVSQVTYSAPWQSIQDVWDGILVDPIKAMVYRENNQKYETYGAGSIDCSELFNSTNDRIIVVTNDNVSGFYIEVGATPNVVKAVVSGANLRAVDGGASVRDYYETFDSDFQDAGFEGGMNITVTGFPTAGNNITAKPIFSINSTRITVDTALLTTESGDADSTITFDKTPVTIDAVECWTGNSWTTVSNLVEGTAGLSKSGFVTFDRVTTAQKTQKITAGTAAAATLPFYGYAWRIRLDKSTSKNVGIGIQAMPYYDITDWGYGMAVSAWKGRISYGFDKHGKEVKVSDIDKPMVLNGFNSGIIEVGDGRENKILAMRPFAAELLVWQEEIGVEGGCLTLLEGYDPKTWGKLVLSTKIGILNSKCAVVIEGVLTSTKTDETVKRLAYWISREGIFVTDGQTVTSISDPIQNYFDTTTSVCIRRGYEDHHYIDYDKSNNCLKIGLASGSSATTANVFLIYDLATKVWGTDTFPINLTCVNTIDANSGNTEVISIAGGADGFMYQVNTGLNDVTGSAPITTPVNAYCVLEIDGNGAKVDIRNVGVRCKAQAAGNITISQALNGNTAFTSINDGTKSMVAANTNDTYRYNDFPIDGVNTQLPDHVSLKFAHNTASEECLLIDFTLLDAEGKNVFQVQ